MTEYYDLEKLKSASIILKKPKKTTKYYYDFDSSSWIKCYPQENLAYDLCAYYLEGKKDKGCVVTCSNSYRLSDNIPDDTNHEYMLSEKEWRDELCVGCDFDLKLRDRWVRGEIIQSVDDIVPGVHFLGPKNFPCFGGSRYYKDDKRLAKKSTHTTPLSDDQLKREREKNRLLNILHDLQEAEINELKEFLPYYEGECIGFYDIRPIYEELKKDPNPITAERLSKEYSAGVKDEYYLPLMGSTIIEDYDVTYTCIRDNISGPYPLSKYDAYFDIRIYNATYCYICVDNNKIEFTPEDDYMTHKSITYDNPLFGSFAECKLYLHTDGDRIEYNVILFKPDMWNCLMCLNNSHAVTYFPIERKVLLLERLYPTYIRNYDDLSIKD